MKYCLIKQQDEKDCAAACLATVAAFYGKRISIAKIRNMAGTDLKGTSGQGIIKAAKLLSFSSKLMIFNNKIISPELPFPCIAHTKKSINNELLEHYVVIFKVKHNKILIGDPADSLKWISKDVFSKDWTGNIFFLSPDTTFEQSTDDKSFFQRFWYLLLQNKHITVQTFIASFVLTILGIFSAFYFRFLIDEVIYSYLPNALVSISLAYLAVIIFQSILGYARNHLIIFLGNKLEASLSLEYFRHILNLPLDFFTKRKSGEILSRFSDINTIKNALSSMCVGVILDCTMLIFDGIVLFAFSSSLITIAVIPVILSGILVLAFAKKFRKLIYIRSVSEAEKYSHFVESINGMSTIKALASEDECNDRAELKIIDSIQKGFTLSNLGNLQSTLQGFLSQAGNLAVYWYGSFLIMQGKLSLGQLISFVTLLGFFLGPLGRLITLQPQLQELSVASKRLGEILDLSEEKSAQGTKLIPKDIKGNICVKNLTFSYGTRGVTLNNINLEIKAGQKVAFVGPSGSGKTTLMKLLLKFYEPESGEITLDDKNIKDFDTQLYRKTFGYVPQEILLFSGTIQDNIAFGNEGATPEEIFEAASNAQALDFISKLEERFATKVGERGASLSGGERQRLALARVLLRKPQILVLDEATSNLDSICEKEIMKTIGKISSGITTIMAAHRLSTIKKCDKIFVLQDGQIVESGTHSSLMRKKGTYAAMWKNQNAED